MTEAQSLTLRAFFIPIFVRDDVKLSRRADATRVIKAKPKGVDMKRTDITALFPDATKEQIDKILDLNGEDISRAKGDLDTAKADLETARTRISELEKTGEDLQAAKTRAAELESELNGLKDANRIRDIREAVAKETGVPAALLTADNEDACKAQAQGIQEFAKGGSYPDVKDAGEATPPAPSGVNGAWHSLISQINQN